MEEKEEGLATELLRDLKKLNKRQFISNIILSIILTISLVTNACLIKYTIDLLNDIGTVEKTTKTQKISDVDTIDNSSIINGDYNGKSGSNSHSD